MQQSKVKSPSKSENSSEETQASPSAAATDLKEHTDELLDEIDTLLEDQEWLANYRQRGGE